MIPIVTSQRLRSRSTLSSDRRRMVSLCSGHDAAPGHAFVSPQGGRPYAEPRFDGAQRHFIRLRSRAGSCLPQSGAAEQRDWRESRAPGKEFANKFARNCCRPGNLIQHAGIPSVDRTIVSPSLGIGMLPARHSKQPRSKQLGPSEPGDLLAHDDEHFLRRCRQRAHHRPNGAGSALEKATRFSAVAQEHPDRGTVRGAPSRLHLQALASWF